MKIDAVYMWVNGNDQKWQQKKAKALAAYTGQPTANGLRETRFIDREELRYSLRSIRQYAPWINHIYIVTDGQTPAWLDCDHPQITIIDHSQIFPTCVVTPTFNSTVISRYLFRIPNLSEHFIYFNDDTMLNRPVTPADFFTARDYPIHCAVYKQLQPQNIFLTDHDLAPIIPATAAKIKDICGQQPNQHFANIMPFYLNAYNLALLTGEKLIPYFTYEHTPYPCRRSQLSQTYQTYRHLFEILDRCQFRDQADVSLTILTAYTHLQRGQFKIIDAQENSLEYALYPCSWNVHSPVEYTKMLLNREKFVALEDFEQPANEEYVTIALMIMQAKYLPCDFELDYQKQCQLHQENLELTMTYQAATLLSFDSRLKRDDKVLQMYQMGKLHRLAELGYRLLGKRR